MLDKRGDRTPFVSIIIPVRNEQGYLDRCLESVISLDYPRNRIEILLIDGMSTDGTIQIIESWIGKDDRIRVLTNPKSTVSAAMNIGLEESKYDLLLWISGHVQLQPDYLRKCVDAMAKTSAAAVGGTLETVAFTTTGKMNALVLSNRFGVGGGAHRVGGKSGWIPEVTMALYRKDAILRAGRWDESLPRSQDNDLHHRMNRIGEKSYLVADAATRYFCRESFPGLLKQAWKNGYWNVMLLKMGRGGFHFRHFAPMIFVGCLLTMGVGSFLSPFLLYILVGALALYLSAAVTVSLFEGMRRHLSRQIPILPFWFLSLHLSYGLASWVGLASPAVRSRKQAAL